MSAFDIPVEELEQVRREHDAARAVNQQEAYPPYSGEEPTCPKCFYIGASARYMAYGRCEHYGSLIIGMFRNERLHRECSNCSYAWDEAVQS